ncbi:hypothetical protein C8R43DRAFT_388268 [Mycena crocata]|nr:hypothetical protein C8R43DRAFT_388268 [Mycena crocata]
MVCFVLPLSKPAVPCEPAAPPRKAHSARPSLARIKARRVASFNVTSTSTPPRHPLRIVARLLDCALWSPSAAPFFSGVVCVPLRPASLSISLSISIFFLSLLQFSSNARGDVKTQIDGRPGRKMMCFQFGRIGLDPATSPMPYRPGVLTGALALPSTSSQCPPSAAPPVPLSPPPTFRAQPPSSRRQGQPIASRRTKRLARCRVSCADG